MARECGPAAWAQQDSADMAAGAGRQQGMPATASMAPAAHTNTTTERCSATTPACVLHSYCSHQPDQCMHACNSGPGSIAHTTCLLSGVVPSGTFRTREGKYVVIGGNGDSVYSRLMAAIGRPDMAADNPK